MEFRTAGFGIAGLVMFTFAAIVIYSIEVDSQKRTLVAEKVALQEVEDNVAATRAATEKARNRLAALREAQSAAAALVQRKESSKQPIPDLENQITELRSLIADQQKQMVAVTGEVRQQAAGDELDEVVFKTGVVLRRAKIERCGDSDITFAHAAGVTRADWKVLPDALISRFRFSDPPAKVPARVAETGNEESAAPPEDEGESVNAKPPPPDRTAGQVNGLQSRISQLRSKVTQAQGTEQLWRQKAAEYRQLHFRAQGLGRISSHITKAEDASKQADAIRKQILQAEDRIRSLEREQADAISGQ